MASIMDYLNQVTAIKAAADSDAAIEQTTIEGLKASLKTEQNQLQADTLVSTTMATLADELSALLPPAPPVPPAVG